MGPDSQGCLPSDERASVLSVSSVADLLKVKADMAFRRIMATYLTNLEELADEHDEAMGKLIDALPADHKASVRLADVYGEKRFDAIRRHVLKAGNDERRDLEQQIDTLCGMDRP